MFAITISFPGRISRRFILPALGLFVLAGCGDETPTRGGAPLPVEVPVSRIAVTPTPTLVVTTRQLTATTLDAKDSVLTGRTVTWSTSDPSLATVDATGLVTSVQSGNVTITATSEGKSGSAAVQVIYIQIISVEVARPTTPILAGNTFRLTAQTLTQTGLHLPRPVTWSTSDLTKARVDQTGFVTTYGTGPVTITAVCEGVSGKVDLMILPGLAGTR